MKSYGLELLGNITIKEVSVLPTWSLSYEKQILYLTTDKHMYYANNVEWVDLYEFDSSRIISIDASKISGIISPENIPSDVFGTFVAVANQAARFSLTATPSGDVSLGDTVLQQDTGNMYYVIDLDNLDSELGYSSAALAFSRVNNTFLDSPVTLLSTDCIGTKTFTNTGATNEVIMLLPPGEDGFRVNAIVTTSNLFTFKASEFETIRYLDVISKLNGYITSSTVGHQLQLEWSGTQWVASIIGENWSIETS